MADEMHKRKTDVSSVFLVAIAGVLGVLLPATTYVRGPQVSGMGIGDKVGKTPG